MAGCVHQLFNYSTATELLRTPTASVTLCSLRRPATCEDKVRTPSNTVLGPRRLGTVTDMRPGEYREYDGLWLAELVATGEVSPLGASRLCSAAGLFGQQRYQCRGSVDARTGCGAGRRTIDRPVRECALSDQGPVPGLCRATHREWVARIGKPGDARAFDGGSALARRRLGDLRKDQHAGVRRKGDH